MNRIGGQRVRAEVYEMTPNVARIIEAILVIVVESKKRRRNVTQYDIVKTLFLADRAHLNNYGRPITYDNYVAMVHGPVPSLAYDFLKEDAYAMRKYGIVRFPWVRRSAPEFGARCNSFEQPERPVDEDVLSPSDIEEIQAALTIVSSLGFKQIRRLTHEDQSYVDAWDDNSEQRQFPMSYALLFDNPNPSIAKEISFLSMHV